MTHSSSPKARLFSVSGGLPALPATPAHSVHAEDLVVGMALDDPGTLALTGWLEPVQFFQPTAQVIWRHLLELQACGLSGTAEDLVLSLRRAGHVEAAGGIRNICQLLERTPAAMPRLDLQAVEIHDLWRLRETEKIMQRAAITTRMGTGDAQELLDAILSEVTVLAEAGRRTAAGIGAGRSSKVRVDELHAIAQNGGMGSALTGRIPTGFGEIDASTSGMGEGEFWILGGRPGLGKTSLALGIAANVSLGQDEGALFFSYEMKHAELAERLISSETGIPLTGLVRADLTDAEWTLAKETADQMLRAPLWLDDDRSLTVSDIASRARAVADRMKARGKRLRLVVVDYLQLIVVAEHKGRSREQEVAEISRALKRLAGDLNVTVLALSQLKREADLSAQTPQMSQLRESGSLEQDADFVGILWRDKKLPAGVTLLQVCKQRKGPAPASLPLGWIPTCTRFYDLGTDEVETTPVVPVWAVAAE